MYLYRSEKDNRRGLPRSFSLSLSPCLCSRPLSPHFNSHPSSQTFWLSVHVPCVWGQRNIPHTAFCLAGWNIPRSIWTKYNRKFSSPVSLLLQAISHLTHYVLLRHMQGAMQNFVVLCKNYQDTFVSTVISFWNLQSHFLNVSSHLELQETLEESRLVISIVCIVLY